MSSWKRSIHIAKHAGPVWDVIVDWPKAPQWMPKVKEATVEPPGAVGKGTRVKVVRGRITIHFTVEEVVPYERLVMSVVEGKNTGSTSFVLRPDGHGTLVDHTLDLHLKGLMKIFAPVVGAGLIKDLEALKARVEGGAG